MPVIVDGETIGSLCVLDVKPKIFSETEVEIIHTLAKALSLEQKRYFVEKNLKKASHEAQMANQAKSQFLASMSHELRTPLNAIIGYSEMLSEDATDMGFDSATEDLEKIMASGRHLLSLINDVLDLSKIEAGKMGIFVETFPLTPLLDEVAATVVPLVAKKQQRTGPENRDR